MSPNYIELNRTFREFDASSIAEEDSFSYGIMPFWGAQKTWEDVLSNNCTVIVAEAGNGKTKELQHQTSQLREAGKLAFFCRLDLLASMPLEMAIEIGERSEFEQWKTSNAHAYFFLDSVDEAKLEKAQDFEQAIIRFVNAIEGFKYRATIIISTRPNAWQAYADQEMLERRLALVSSTKISPRSLEHKEQFGEQVYTEGDEDATDTESHEHKVISVISVLQMIPLDVQRVRIFASASGVEDVDQFMDAIEHADADVFARRPADLPGLIDLWKTQRRIGSYSDVVLNDIRLKLSESNIKHQQALNIADDRILMGAEMLAAAVTLSRRFSLLVPDQDVDEVRKTNAINPVEVLPGWTHTEIYALLGRALFDESMYGTVRFHHRIAREYLAAKWFLRLLKQSNKKRRKIEQLFFAMPYGTEREVVIPSMKPILGWLAVWNQRFRDKAISVDPKVLLEFGDSSSLDVETRKYLLKEFARRYENQKHTSISLHIREVRRFADHQLSDTVRELLTIYRYHNDVRHLLLRIIREGEISSCGELVITFFYDVNMDTYARACAVQAVGVAGQPKEKKELAEKVLEVMANLNHQIIAAAIEALWPDYLSDKNILQIIKAIESPMNFSSGYIEPQLINLADQLPVSERQTEMLRAVVDLLSLPPLHGEHYCCISTRYDWLLPFAWRLMKRIVQSNPVFTTDSLILTVAAMTEQANYLHRYTGNIREEFIQLVRSNSQFKHALFWYKIEEARTRYQRPVTDYYMVRHSPVMDFSDADVSHFCNAIKQRPLFEDKLVALSVMIAIYFRSEKQNEVLHEIRKAVEGESQLEAVLNEQMNPVEPSGEQKRIQTVFEKKEKAREIRQLQQEKYHNDWVNTLRDDTTKIGDLSIAVEGKVWNNTIWLFEEIRKKSKENNRWAQERWELLEKDFGPRVATEFRDFCRSFWRCYVPELRSEAGKYNQRTPWATIIGLSGLAMEARSSEEWLSNITQDDAVIATRYALYEINDFPAWFLTLYRKYPNEVAQLLISEIEWELQQHRSREEPGYVLSRLRWTAKEIGQALRRDIIPLVECYPRAELTTLVEALTVILSNSDLLPDSFQYAVVTHATKTRKQEYKALWFSVLLCINPQKVIDAIERWVKSGRVRKIRESRITLLLCYLWGDKLTTLSLLSQFREFMQVDILLRLLKLTHKYVRIEEDVHHNGTYSPDLRDYAQEARSRLLEFLFNIPGQRTYEALLDLHAFHTLEYPKDRMLMLAEQRAEADVEFEAWPTTEVALFAQEIERNPATQQDLFNLALSRLEDLKLDIEEGDESEASLLKKVEDEIELRRVIANRLKQVAHGKYTTGSEEELADETRTDIRLHNPAVDARVPIELKIAGQWSFNELKERLENQLVGQYMREARYGVFLLVNREADNDRKSWTISKSRQPFEVLVRRLKQMAINMLGLNHGIDGIEVVGIDLSIRCPVLATRGMVSAKKPANKSKKKRSGKMGAMADDN